MTRWLWVILLVFSGCGGDARMEMSAADALSAAASQMETTLREYHDEVGRYDDARESQVVAAFVERVKVAATEPAAVESHTGDFRSALKAIRQDREAEHARLAAARDNVGVLREMAKGMQRLAIDSLSLQDEMRRYLAGWMEARRKAEAAD
ncbi:MAG: hypothetical protein KA354_14555 [Phycisphaerae bacterium]|nr:hypothetical protein [Phycisphaerae bacterium]